MIQGTINRNQNGTKNQKKINILKRGTCGIWALSLKIFDSRICAMCVTKCEPFRPDNKTCNIREGSLDVISIHNGEFGFPAGHEFLLQYMESANRTYDPMSDKRNQVGPSHAVLVATQMYKTRLTNRILDKGKR